jgi:exodeoxyribonuclease-5
MCRTIYSLLGLTLSNEGEVKELKGPKKPLDLRQYTAVIVDEASMISKQLFEHIEATAVRFNVRFLFMGDAAQLPPINETRSKVWEIGSFAELTKVMRHDNAILELATRVRMEVDTEEPYTKLLANNDGIEGVWQLDKDSFKAMIRQDAADGKFSAPNVSKIIAWRNVQVDAFNKLVRDVIFPDAPKWVIGDRLLFASVVKDQTDRVLAHIDDEGIIRGVEIQQEAGFKVWSLEVEIDEGNIVVVTVLHDDHKDVYQKALALLAEQCRCREKKWFQFWALKELFTEVKYAYAITAHRSQGSTYENAYVCWQDILRNQDVNEAYRCLYVAVTRPKHKLILS